MMTAIATPESNAAERTSKGRGSVENEGILRARSLTVVLCPPGETVSGRGGSDQKIRESGERH